MGFVTGNVRGAGQFRVRDGRQTEKPTATQEPNAERNQFVLDCCLYSVCLLCRERACTQRSQGGQQV